ncbi:15495_t:CDS:2, partial [Cetraspora pellucida]
KSPNTRATISRIHVFGLNAIDVEREHKRKKRQRQSLSLKPFNSLSESMKTKRSCAFFIHLGEVFDNQVPKFFNLLDQPVLQEVKFNIQDKNFVIDYNDDYKENSDSIRFLVLFLEVIDQDPISHHAYHTGTRINQEMSIKISIFTLNIENMTLETSNIDVDIDTSDQEVKEEVLKYVGKAYYRRITDIFIYIIPSLVNQSILNTNNPVINIRISDDMLNIHKADFHYTLILYPGVENYEILKKVIKLLITKLNNLTMNGLVNSYGIKWRIEFYFSSDWKFMAIILGFNAPNSNNFCSWCLCTKKDIRNKDKTYKIEKTMDLLKSDSPPPGHLKTPLLPMIQIKSENKYDNHIRMIISLEMKRISITFRFWQNHNIQNWSHTPIMRGDKEKILRDFNFEVIFDKEQATLINCLWRDFYLLYRLMKELNAVSTLFIVKVKEWFNLFLTPYQGIPNTRTFKKGLYRSKDVMPYIHVLVHYVPEFMVHYQNFGLAVFSYVAVEKKNHAQVSLFYKKSMKDGGKGMERKSIILEILNYENQSLYYTYQSTFSSTSKPQYLHIKKK